MYDVIIVGGGAAGLMAAKVVADAGKKTLLLEARGHLGGRIAPAEGFSFAAAGGAEFIHGNLKTTFSLLKEAGLKKERLKGKFCRVESGQWSVNDNLVPGWDQLIKKMNACKEDQSILSFLNTHFKGRQHGQLKKYFINYVQGFDAADPAKTSLFEVRKEMQGEDEDQFRPVPGYEALVSWLENNCRRHGAEITTSQAVNKIARDQNVIVCAGEKTFRCKKLICAVPLAVLQARSGTTSFIQFPGFLNHYLRAAKKMGSGAVIKFLLEFDQAFWLENNFLEARKVPAPSYIFTDAFIPTWWTQFPSRLPLLTGWIAGPPADKIKHYSNPQFKKAALESLSSIFQMPFDGLSKRLKHFALMNWPEEPHILGGYSYPTLQSTASRNILNKPFENQIYFAGEYLSEEAPATVEAALLSGKKAGEKAIYGFKS